MTSAPYRQSPRRMSGPALDAWIDAIAACPWPAHAGVKLTAATPAPSRAAPLYTPDERRRRDASAWTTVQAVLAPLQFAAFAVSLWLVLRFLITGHGYELAIISIIVKTALLYTIMVTGSIWEKDVFGKWLFARPFFWEDVFSMLVLALHSAYLLALLNGWGSPQTQMYIAICAYATYVINAAQFVMKLRAARIEAGMHSDLSPHALGRAA